MFGLFNLWHKKEHQVEKMGGGSWINQEAFYGSKPSTGSGQDAD